MIDREIPKDQISVKVNDNSVQEEFHLPDKGLPFVTLTDGASEIYVIPRVHGRKMDIDYPIVQIDTFVAILSIGDVLTDRSIKWRYLDEGEYATIGRPPGPEKDVLTAMRTGKA